MLNLCVYLIYIRLPRDIELKLEPFVRKFIPIWKKGFEIHFEGLGLKQIS